MSPENTDSDAAPAEHQRLLSSKTVLGIVCFGGGLLVLASGILLALRWLLDGDAVALLVGILLALIGIAINATGLVLLYRGVTAPGQGAGNDNGNP